MAEAIFGQRLLQGFVLTVVLLLVPDRRDVAEAAVQPTRLEDTLAKEAPLPFTLVYAAVSALFVVLAVLRRAGGSRSNSHRRGAIRTSFFNLPLSSSLLNDVELVYAVLQADLLAGVGLVVLLRHGWSLRAVVALECQDRLRRRAGYVQLACDAVVRLLSVFVIAPLILMLSLAGAVVLIPCLRSDTARSVAERASRAEPSRRLYNRPQVRVAASGPGARRSARSGRGHHWSSDRVTARRDDLCR